jgi:hypothetical protein
MVMVDYINGDLEVVTPATDVYSTALMLLLALHPAAEKKLQEDADNIRKTHRVMEFLRVQRPDLVSLIPDFSMHLASVYHAFTLHQGLLQDLAGELPEVIVTALEGGLAFNPAERLCMSEFVKKLSEGAAILQGQVAAAAAGVGLGEQVGVALVTDGDEVAVAALTPDEGEQQ